MYRSFRLFVACTLVALAGCGDLTRGAVTSIPPGTGTGTAFTGIYGLVARTNLCEGVCIPINLGQVTGVPCQFGQVTNLDVIATQNGGQFSATADPDGFIIAALMGGINIDGSFDIGGARQVGGKNVESKSRITGRIDSSGFFLAKLRIHTVGDISDRLFLDCFATIDVEGFRRN